MVASVNSGFLIPRRPRSVLQYNVDGSKDIVKREDPGILLMD